MPNGGNNVSTPFYNQNSDKPQAPPRTQASQ